MAAYAALVTLMNTVEQIQNHPRLPVSFDKKQVEFLTENVTFLQRYLEDHSHGRQPGEAADDLESRIADAARTAEDVIESHVADRVLGSSSRGEKKFYKCLHKVVHQILARSMTNDERSFYESLEEVVHHVRARLKSFGKNFHECLQKVVEDMDLIKMEVMDEIKGAVTPIQIHLRPTVSSRWDPQRKPSKGHNFVVGFDEVLHEMMDRLTGHESRRQIIPIAGMGGIGKTTLATTVYSHTSVQQHFDVRAWTTISQVYDTCEIFVQILSQIGNRDKEDLREMSENDLKLALHKSLMSRRYLIILDDIWNIEAWEEIQLFFPDCNNGSRVVITTRLSNLASQVNNNSYCLKMKFLDEDRSWNLFCRVVFGEENCTLDHLKEMGKKIARGCKGLPLSICVVGGLLAKAQDEVEYWEYVVENLNSVVNLEDNEHCLKLLHMSYIQLPTHLKPCFLHMGIFPEDERIRVSEVIELWITEGFLKPISGKAIEGVAKEYFNELIERNLISVHSLGTLGAIKYCNIHDLLRDFCLRQAQKERFENVIELHNSQQGKNVGNIYVSRDWRLMLEQKYHAAFHSLQLPCSLYNYSSQSNSRLLRIWTKCCESFHLRYGDSLNDLFKLLYVPAKPDGHINRLWNYKTLSMYTWMVLRAPSEIWNMPYIRHVRMGRKEVMDPVCCDDDNNVLGKLETVDTVNFKCSEEMVKRIQNIKKLRTTWNIRLGRQGEWSSFLNNIDRLQKLESFVVTFMPNSDTIFHNLTFPNSLKKLTIERFDADGFLGKIGSLPFLVKLKLIGGFFNNEKEWVTVEGQFRSLRFLLIKHCYQLEYWKTESSHFPVLEQLTLYGLYDLKEIPSHFPRLEKLTLYNLHDLKEIPLEMGDIPTLESIHVTYCSSSVAISAENIQKEQEELGNEGLQVRIKMCGPVETSIQS